MRGVRMMKTGTVSARYTSSTIDVIRVILIDDEDSDEPIICITAPD